MRGKPLLRITTMTGKTVSTRAKKEDIPELVKFWVNRPHVKTVTVIGG